MGSWCFGTFCCFCLVFVIGGCFFLASRRGIVIFGFAVKPKGKLCQIVIIVLTVVDC